VGENLSNVGLAGDKSNSIYDNIEMLDTSEDYIDYQSITRNMTNLVVIALLGIMVWIFRKQR
jgi:Na+/H+ antiporter NhaC